jgi:hypothetical protein
VGRAGVPDAALDTGASPVVAAQQSRLRRRPDSKPRDAARCLIALISYICISVHKSRKNRFLLADALADVLSGIFKRSALVSASTLEVATVDLEDRISWRIFAIL